MNALRLETFTSHIAGLPRQKMHRFMLKSLKPQQRQLDICALKKAQPFIDFDFNEGTMNDWEKAIHKKAGELYDRVHVQKELFGKVLAEFDLSSLKVCPQSRGGLHNLF
jgi:hypothetical protein